MTGRAVSENDKTSGEVVPIECKALNKAAVRRLAGITSGEREFLECQEFLIFQESSPGAAAIL